MTEEIGSKVLGEQVDSGVWTSKKKPKKDKTEEPSKEKTKE